VLSKRRPWRVPVRVSFKSRIPGAKKLKEETSKTQHDKQSPFVRSAISLLSRDFSGGMYIHAYTYIHNNIHTNT
jgi:hypothetical protein